MYKEEYYLKGNQVYFTGETGEGRYPSVRSKPDQVSIGGEPRVDERKGCIGFCWVLLTDLQLLWGSTDAGAGPCCEHLPHVQDTSARGSCQKTLIAHRQNSPLWLPVTLTAVGLPRSSPSLASLPQGIQIELSGFKIPGKWPVSKWQSIRPHFLHQPSLTCPPWTSPSQLG